MASPALSQASTAFESDAPQNQDEQQKGQRRAALQRAKDSTTSQDIFWFLVAFRILNALSIRTFFQPDEYFQSLEPAWEISFGADSGAWITWEWKNQLRSAIHPAIFAGVYYITSELSNLLRLASEYRAELLLAAPKVTQAIFAALGDYYTWKLGGRVYGNGSNEAWIALFLTVSSPWQWFVSTRTLSNCLETTLTIIALHQWPWHWSIDVVGDEKTDKYGLREDEQEDQAEELAKCVPEDGHLVASRSTAYRLCRCLLLAAVACVLRPTNVLIWICLASFSLWTSEPGGHMLKLPWIRGSLWVHITSMARGPATNRERISLVLEAAVCGTIVLASSAIVDRLYYLQWTFPPARFLYFNLARSLSVHYGRNPWHYYLSQGYPLLLTTFLPFALAGLYRSLFPPDHPPSPQNLLTTTIKRQLATIALLVPFILSFISHKEVRFVYPLLPLLHILSTEPFTHYFRPLLTQTTHPVSKNKKTKKRLLFLLILLTNISLGIFTTHLHQPGPLSLLTYLRSRAPEQTLHRQSPQSHSPAAPSTTPQTTTTTIAFLTPCHSTPWRSHLIHPSLKAWALSCSPPLHLPPSAHSTYLDEADQFYSSPSHWLTLHLGRPPKNTHEATLRIAALETATGVAWDSLSDRNPSAHEGEKGVGRGKGKGREKKKVWTHYLVFFGQLEKVMEKVTRESGYGVCWRGWNGLGGWNEDWRRRGGVVVFCLDEGEKRGWREGEERERRWREEGGGRWWGAARSLGW